jgi:hypothetical protein
MRAAWIGAAGIVAVALGAGAAAQEAPAPPIAATETVGAVLKEFDAAVAEHRKAWEAARKAGTQVPRAPDARVYAARVLAAVEASADPAEAATGVRWLMLRASGQAERARARELCGTRCLDRPEMADVAQALQRTRDAADHALLRTLLTHSPHAAVQAQACFALAKVLLATRADDAAATAEAETLLERCIKEFADAKHWRGSLGAAADAELYERRHLAVGRPAPEIEGIDPAGATFRLSEFRGRVVVVDFWGDW